MSILSINTNSVIRRLGLANISWLKSINYRAISSKEILEKEKKVLANNYDVLPIVVSKGQGVYMWDVEGKKYLDFFAGFATLNQGHCHPKIVKALQEQAEILHHTSRAISHNTLYQLAETLTTLFNFEKVFLTNTGAEGIEAAIKLSRKWGYSVKKIPKDKAGIVFATGNFHGRTMAAISASTEPISTEQFGPLLSGYHIIPYNDLEKLEEKLQDPNICAFIVEPVQGEAGAVVPDDGYLQGIRKLCTKYNVLWVDDEIQAGMARTGKLLAVNHELVEPDILILGKAISGGIYPVSAVLADSSVMDCFTPGTHGSTYGGNPLACKVASVAIDVILTENLSENAAKMGEIFRSELSNRLDKNRVITVRGKGLLNAVVIDPKLFHSKDIVYKLKENGLVTKHIKDNIIRFSPALTITEEQLRTGIDIIVNTINNMPIKKL